MRSLATKASPSLFSGIARVMVASVLWLGLLNGCASINSVSVTPIPKDRSKPVKVEASRLIVLFLNFDNDFVDSMVTQLKSQCPGGKVTGILTKDEDIMYFLGFVYKKRVTAQGYCVSAAGA